VEYQQGYQHIHNGSPRRKGERKDLKKTKEDNLALHFKIEYARGNQHKCPSMKEE
jgi:hypothetical protein